MMIILEGVTIGGKQVVLNGFNEEEETSGQCVGCDSKNATLKESLAYEPDPSKRERAMLCDECYKEYERSLFGF